MWEAVRLLVRLLVAVTKAREPEGMMASGRVLVEDIVAVSEEDTGGGYGVVWIRRGLVGELNRLHVPKSTLLSGKRGHEQPVNVLDNWEDLQPPSNPV